MHPAMARQPSMDKDELLSAMEERAKDLLVRLEGFKQIEDEYRTITKAMRVLRGEALYNNAQSKDVVQSSPDAQTASSGVRSAGLQEAYLAVISRHAEGICPSDAFREIKVGELTSVYTVCRRLGEKGLVTSASRNGKNYYTVTEGGREALGTMSGQRSNPMGPTNSGKFVIMDAMKALAGMPQGGTRDQIMAAMGLGREFNDRASTSLPYIRVKGWAKTHVNKDGRTVYTLTPSGKNKVAMSLGV